MDVCRRKQVQTPDLFKRYAIVEHVSDPRRRNVAVPVFMQFSASPAQLLPPSSTQRAPAVLLESLLESLRGLLLESLAIRINGYMDAILEYIFETYCF
jgi:hypothetical protein